jgi:hypothetical protein
MMPNYRRATQKHQTELSCWEAAVFCAARAKRLNKYETAFIKCMLLLTGRGYRLSFKQQRWLSDIYDRLGGP